MDLAPERRFLFSFGFVVGGGDPTKLLVVGGGNACDATVCCWDFAHSQSQLTQKTFRLGQTGVTQFLRNTPTHSKLYLP